MAMELSTTFNLIARMIAGQDTDLSDVEGTLNFSKAKTLTDGTGADKADLVYDDEHTLAASATQDYDLAGSLSDMFGNTITFARIKAIMIKNTSDELGTPTDAIIAVGGAAANQFANWVNDASDKVNITAGGVFILMAPDATAYAVTAGTGDLLRITNNDGADQAQYEIILIGEST